MSNSYQPSSPSGKVDSAKQEASDLKDTATTQAKDVIGTAKEEAASVVGEAKVQARDLYRQTQQELRDQADTQQQRVAAGLRSVSDELNSMAANSDGAGVASDLVQQVSGRLSAAATWLGERDSASLLTEVKRFARRKPGTFILGAAFAGIVVGRLTRALAANAADDKADTPVPTSAPAPKVADTGMPASAGAAGIDAVGEPIYAQTAARADLVGEDGYDRRDTV